MNRRPRPADWFLMAAVAAMLVAIWTDTQFHWMWK